MCIAGLQHTSISGDRTNPWNKIYDATFRKMLHCIFPLELELTTVVGKYAPDILNIYPDREVFVPPPYLCAPAYFGYFWLNCMWFLENSCFNYTPRHFMN